MLRQPRQIILFLGDVAGLHLALFLTLVLRYPRDLWGTNWQSHWPNFLAVFLIWLVILYINSLYNLNSAGGGSEFYRSLLNAAAVSTVLSILYFYLNLKSPVAPKTNLAIFIVLFIIIFYLWRRLYQAVVHTVLTKDKLALIGSQAKTEKLLMEIKNNPGAGYQGGLIINHPTDLTTVAEQIKNNNIRTLVIAEDFSSPEIISKILTDCWRYDIDIFDYADFYERLTGKIPVEVIGPAWFLKNIQTGQKKYFNWLKQLLDWLLALVILIISLPAWPLLAIFIKLNSAGPVFFRQTRLGRDGQAFTIIKFRTMRQEDNHQGPTEANDDRVTRGGSFLRTTRLDELPQVLNILRGDMSFIGPRPEQPAIVAEREKEIPFYRTRLLVKPGLTGWDQISGEYHSSSAADTLTKLQYDLFYLKQRSFYLDISIALKTIATIMSRAGR